MRITVKFFITKYRVLQVGCLGSSFLILVSVDFALQGDHTQVKVKFPVFSLCLQISLYFNVKNGSITIVTVMKLSTSVTLKLKLISPNSLRFL